MIRLLSLPNELLLEIALRVGDMRLPETLRNLSLTCRQLRHIGQEALVRAGVVPLGKLDRYIDLLLQKPELAKLVTHLGIVAWPLISDQIKDREERERDGSASTSRKSRFIQADDDDDDEDEMECLKMKNRHRGVRVHPNKLDRYRETVYQLKDFPFRKDQWEKLFGGTQLLATLLVLLPNVDALSIQADLLVDIPLVEHFVSPRKQEHSSTPDAKMEIAQELLGNRIKTFDAGICSWNSWGTWYDEYSFYRFTKLEFLSAPYIDVGDDYEGLRVPRGVQTIQFNHCYVLPLSEFRRLQEHKDELTGLREVRFVFHIPFEVLIQGILKGENWYARDRKLDYRQLWEKGSPYWSRPWMWDISETTIENILGYIAAFEKSGVNIETYFPTTMPTLFHKAKSGGRRDVEGHAPFPSYRLDAYTAEDAALRIPHHMYDLAGALRAILHSMKNGNSIGDWETLGIDGDPHKVVYNHYRPLLLEGDDMRRWLDSDGNEMKEDATVDEGKVEKQEHGY